MKYCTSCGKELKDSAKFCTSCGKKCTENHREKAQNIEILQECPKEQIFHDTAPNYHEETTAVENILPKEDTYREKGTPVTESGQKGEPTELAVEGKKNTSKGKFILICTMGIILMALAIAVVLYFTGNVGHKNDKGHIHSWRSASCDSPKTCRECGTTEGTSLGHRWIEATYDTPKTCTVCGITRGKPMERPAVQETLHTHSWEAATYNEPKTCRLCSETEGAKKKASSSLGLRDIISDVSASSVYAGDYLGEHGPEKMYDGKLDTNWTENKSGSGIGEYVTFYFNGTYAIKKIEIYIGSHYDEDYYRKNCRPKVIELAFSDGSTERINLKDSYDIQIITLDQYYYTDYVILTIEDVYSGTKYTDTVIAELDFVAYKP